MKNKNGLLFIILGIFSLLTLILSIIGFFELSVELEDELGLFFILLSFVPTFISIGMTIGFIIKGEKQWVKV